MVQTVPVVPTRIRKERFREAIEDYVAGEISEAEMEAEMDAAIEGRIEYERLLKLQGTIRAPPQDPGALKFMGVDITHGEDVVAENVDYLDLAEINTTVSVDGDCGPILGGQTVQ